MHIRNYKHEGTTNSVSRNSIGQRLVLSSFGESHGKVIGAILDGCPAGMTLQESDIQPMLDRRRPGQSAITSQRKEEDTVRIVSGTYKGRTTGAPITMLADNADQISADYDELRTHPRPGHSDYTAMAKYGGFNDHRGSGRFSGRLTATHVMGGAVARKLLSVSLGVRTCSFVQQIGPISMQDDGSAQDGAADRGADAPAASRDRTYDDESIYANDARCPDGPTAQSMKEAITTARKSGDSLGGIVKSVTTGVPVGLGEPMYGSLESDISAAIFSIPSVKGVEFGSGFAGAATYGSSNNDAFEIADDKHSQNGTKNRRIVTRTNNAGGILGGISSGMPITMRVAFKPVSSIAQEQSTVDISTMTDSTLRVKGRHDPCVVPRALPVVDALVSLVIADHALASGRIGQVVEDDG